MDKKKYIYNNIQKISDHSIIIDFINNKNIPFTENNNGIYINISLLDPSIIESIYNMINIMINHQSDDNLKEVEYDNNDINDNNDNDDNDNKIQENSKNIQNKKLIEKKYKKIKLTRLQLELLNTIK